MFKYVFLSDTEVMITNGSDINIVQNRDPETGELFKTKNDAQLWLDSYSRQINETIYDNLQFIKEQKKKEISDACELAITIDGFQSSAHGNISKIYGSSSNEQFEIQNLVITAISKPDEKLYWKAKDEELSEWTADEILKLWGDLKENRESYITRCTVIKNYIDNQNNEAIIMNINWSTGIPE